MDDDNAARRNPVHEIVATARARMLAGRSSGSRHSGAHTTLPTGHRFPSHSSALGGFRHHSPPRDSLGLAPDSLLSRHAAQHVRTSDAQDLSTVADPLTMPFLVIVAQLLVIVLA